MIYELLKDRIMNGGAGSEAIIESLAITANGTYTAPSGTDGYNPITVNVPQKEPNIQNLSITTNGTYTAPSGTDGYSPVVVDVQPNLENITITANGTYSHAGKDGYDQVVVNVPQEGLDVSNITIPDSPNSLFSNKKWNELMPYFRNITINPGSNSWNLSNLFSGGDNYTDLSHITFKMSCNMHYFNGIQKTFSGCLKLTALPIFDWSSTSVSAPNDRFYVSNMFQSCQNLRTIPDTFFSNIPLSDSYTSNISGGNLFSYCYSLRKVPDLSWFDGKNTYFSSDNIYNYIFYQCSSLDEIVDLPVLKTSSTRDGFDNGFYGCFRIKEMTFKTGTDSAPRADSGWNSQVIDLSQKVGYTTNNYPILGYNSGITADKEVTDDASYQALKNDPDWFTGNPAYSRYNHNSAVNTINSLPDCAAFGTNTIKFLGASGSATDGGAISTLTAEEIAVATTKGWTVTLV